MRIFGVFLVVTAFVGTLSGCAKKPQVPWEAYDPEIMDQALHSGQPIVAYFYAAWCPPCYHLKEKTFSDPRVIEALEPFRKIKFDLSFKHSPKIIELNQKYQIMALPEIHLIPPPGDPRPEMRLRGFISADQFLEVLQKFQSSDI